MLDIKFIEENIDLIKETAKNKGVEIDLEKLISLAEKRRELLQKVEAIRAEQNAANEKISKLQGDEKQAAIAEMKEIASSAKPLNEELKQVEEQYNYMLLFVPQPTSPETPVGKDDTENVEVRTWGEKPNFDFEPKDHVQLGLDLDIIDIPRGVKISGSRNYFLKGDGARLEMAVLQYTLNSLIKKGFTQMTVPLLVDHESMVGTSYFPGGEEQAYHIEKDERHLVGSAEVPLTAYHREEILKESELPKKYCALSSCFRREAGTYGKDTHGLYRVHQFLKVEQVIVSKNDEEESQKLHQMILQNAEDVLQDLKLPYRVVNVCTGDIGQGQYFKNDIETWMPSRESYGETHSCSTFHEFQARRLNLRYKDENGKTRFCHTLNNTCVASPRILIPLLEIYQNADGSITIPEVLRPYMAGQEKIEPKAL